MYVLIDGKPVDLGVAYGYCFHPEVLTHVGGCYSALTPLVKDNGHWSIHPYFDSCAEAEEWLVTWGVAGQILRYAHHLPLLERTENYRPWVTAGIVACVDGDYLVDISSEFEIAHQWCEQIKEQYRNTDWHALRRES